MKNLEGADAQELIAAWRRAEKSRAVARRSVTLVVLGVIAVYGCLIWTVIQDFRTRRLPEFTAALSMEAGNLAPGLVADSRAIVNRVYPVYVQAFQNMFERDMDKMKDLVSSEMSTLNAYAQSKWPDIERETMNVVIASEEVVLEELGRFMTPAEAKRTTEAYSAALGTKYEALLSTTLKEHANIASEIGENLDRIAATEPDIQKPVSMNCAVGMLLERAGTGLQTSL